MALSIHTIKPGKKAVKKRKRIGRGNSSGHGTYSTRGIKGQKARSGTSNLKRLGMRQILLRTPKKRGFQSLYPKQKVINLSLLNLYFQDGDIVTPKTLIAKKIIKNGKNGIKILGEGELKLKNLRVSGLNLSKSAKEKIEKMGGIIN